MYIFTNRVNAFRHQVQINVSTGLKNKNKLNSKSTWRSLECKNVKTVA